MVLSKEVAFFERTALTILSGKKVDGGPSQIPKNISKLLALHLKLHAFGLVAPEPQSVIRLTEFTHSDRNGLYLGQTHIHAVSDKISQDAEHLKSVCILKNQPIADFEILGLDWEKRQSWRHSADFQTDKVAVLVAGDDVSLWQITSLMRQRENGVTGKPIIIQNTNMLWDPVLVPILKSWKKKKIKPEDLGIFLSAGAPETADILASLEGLPKINPKNIKFHYATFPEIKNPFYLFATTDDKKFAEVKAGLKHSGAEGRIRRVFDIWGKSEIPTEEKYSFEGNAAEKMEALIARIRELGVDVATQLLKSHGYNDLSEIVLMTNDGGLGVCLENDKGERETQLFTAEFFPDTYHRMNPTQMSPGVELAYLMRTIGLEAAFSQLQKSVRSICSRSKGKFKVEDLRAYDTSLNMAVPLTRVFDAIQNGKPCDLHSLGVVSVFSGQKLKISNEPKGPVDGTPETINYLQIPLTNDTRAEKPDDVVNWPNAKGFKILQRYTGLDTKKDARLAFNKQSEMEPITMGLLATPSLLFAKVESPQLTNLRKRLRTAHKIAVTNTGNDWQKFKDRLPNVISQAAHRRSNSAFRAGIREMLDKCVTTNEKCSVFYVGEQKSYSKSNEAKVLQGLSFLTAIVRNQIFNPVNLVVNRNAVPHLIKLIEHKKRLGLIGQSMGQLMTMVDGEAEAATAINQIVRGESYKVTQLDRKFSTDGQLENKQSMTATAYFSASNVNGSLIKQAERLGYLMAVNGFNLKIGGGNDGLMRAAADGFQKGKRELFTKGYDYPNQLILVQCVDTESIEKRYDGGGIYRCHPTIESREADLQNTDFVIAGAGGAGTDEEIFAEFYSRLNGLSDPARKPMVLFNQQVQTTAGMVGVHDPYKEMFDDEFMKTMNASFIMTPEEILAQAVAHRSQMWHSEQVISCESLRLKMKQVTALKNGGKMVGTTYASKRFSPPYGIYTAQAGQLPQAESQPEYKQFKVA